MEDFQMHQLCTRELFFGGFFFINKRTCVSGVLKDFLVFFLSFISREKILKYITKDRYIKRIFRILYGVIYFSEIKYLLPFSKLYRFLLQIFHLLCLFPTQKLFLMFTNFSFVFFFFLFIRYSVQ